MGGGAGCFPFLPGTPGPFNKSLNSQESLHTLTDSESLRGEIQPPAEGVAGAHELSCVGWKVKGPRDVPSGLSNTENL